MNQKVSSKNNRKLNLVYCHNLYNKRGFSAKGLSLLPLALRPRLLRFKLVKVGILPVIAIPSLLYIVNYVVNVSVSDVSAASITLTIPKTLSLNVNPAANNGFAKSETPGTITVTTDNSVGYTLNIKAKNETNDLLNGNNKIISISNNLSESDFKSSSESNIWGFLPSKLYNTESGTSQDNTSFIPGPKNSEGTTIDVTDSANPDAANSYNISLGAKVDSTIPAGSYSNTFIISATTNELPYEKMQDWEGCDSLENDQTITLMDSRDNKLYTVAKLKDGKCWMTQNLALGKDETMTLTSSDSDVSSDYTLPASSTSGFSDDTAQNIYVTPAPDNNKYGGYYTWPAATAGTNPSSGEASSSICPKGWRLPTKSELGTITRSYDDSTIQQSPANFVLAGYYNSSSLNYQGTLGYWWSSTASNSTNAYSLDLSPGSRNFSDFYTTGSYKRYGNSIRCVSRSTDPTMQNVDKWASTIEKGESLEGVVDTRDGNTYTVARQEDGKLWMTQNLRLGDSKLTNRTLTSADSDVSANYTLPESSPSGFTGTNPDKIYVPDSESGDYKMEYGGYYTWVAATAGTGASITTDHQNAPSSICPKGWRLPMGSDKNDNTNEFALLVKAYGGTGQSVTDTTLNAKLMTPSLPNFVFSGRYNYSSPYAQGSRGVWWSSTSCMSDSGYSLYLRSDGLVNPLDFSSRSYGYSVRCIARTDDPKTMQDVETWGPTIKKGQSVNAIDSRDGNTYKVARLEDGNLWMVENLRLGDSKLTNRTLTSADSDVSANYTVPGSSPSGFTGTNPDKIYVPDEESGNYKMEYGGYYTWVAATAGTGASITTDYQNAPSSICPKGWRLPKGSDKNDNTNEFALLVKAYGGTGDTVADSALSAKLVTPSLPNFVFSGYYYDSSPGNQGSSGYWWSSTSCVSDKGYDLYLNSSGRVHPLSNDYRNNGHSVRCIAR